MRSNFICYGLGAIGGVLLVWKIQQAFGFSWLSVVAGMAAVLFSSLVIASVLARFALIKPVKPEEEALIPGCLRNSLRPMALFAALGVAATAATWIYTTEFCCWISLDQIRDLNQKSKHAEALKLANKYTAAHPRDAEGWDELSYTYNCLLKYQDACGAAEKSLAINQSYVNALANHAWALNGLGKYEQALVQSQKALSGDSEFAEAWCAQGDAHFGLGNYQKALVAFDRHQVLHPDEWYGYNRRAETHEKLGHPDLAAADRKTAESCN